MSSIQLRSTSRILLFGEVLVDRFPDREVLGGAPFNVAHHLFGLGRNAGLVPILVTRMGQDERGDRLLSMIRSAGLSTEGIQRDGTHRTGEVEVTLDAASGKHGFKIGPDQAWDFIQPDTAHFMGGDLPQWIYFGTLAQRGESHLALRALLQATHVRGFLDINLRDPWVREDVLRWSLEQAEVVKVSGEELLRVADMFGFNNGTSLELGQRLIQTFDIRQLLVTDGERGAWHLTADNVYAHTSPTEPINQASTVVDTVGAGDAFSAVFLLGLILNWPIEQTLERAHAFAGKICGLRGAIPDSLGFYHPFIAEWHLAGEGET